MTDRQELEYSLNTDSVSRFVMYVEAKKDITILDDSCSDILLKCFYIKATNIASFILDFDKQLNYSCFKEFKGVPFCTTYTPFLFFLWQDSVSLFRDNKNLLDRLYSKIIFKHREEAKKYVLSNTKSIERIFNNLDSDHYKQRFADRIVDLVGLKNYYTYSFSDYGER